MYSDKKLNFEELLERDSSVSIHHQNIRFLAIEMFKVFKGISPQIVRFLNSIFASINLVLFDLRSHT